MAEAAVQLLERTVRLDAAALLNLVGEIQVRLVIVQRPAAHQEDPARLVAAGEKAGRQLGGGGSGELPPPGAFGAEGAKVFARPTRHGRRGVAGAPGQLGVLPGQRRDEGAEPRPKVVAGQSVFGGGVRFNQPCGPVAGLEVGVEVGLQVEAALGPDGGLHDEARLRDGELGGGPVPDLVGGDVLTAVTQFVRPRAVLDHVVEPAFLA